MENGKREPQQATKPEARYANSFRIGYNAFEFLIDFGQLYDRDKSRQLHTRIITGPFYAKELFEMLRKALEQYEQTYGGLPRE